MVEDDSFRRFNSYSESSSYLRDSEGAVMFESRSQIHYNVETNNFIDRN
jgi:hypothetical protein